MFHCIVVMNIPYLSTSLDYFVLSVAADASNCR